MCGVFSHCGVLMLVPAEAVRFGFANQPAGTHGSRTIMLTELRRLLAARPAYAAYDEYRAAAVDENVLLKSTISTRKESLRRLRELYAIDRDVLLFWALRDLWDDDSSAQPLIALLCAAARDPILRASAGLILAAEQGMPITPQMIEAATEEHFPGRTTR